MQPYAKILLLVLSAEFPNHFVGFNKKVKFKGIETVTNCHGLEIPVPNRDESVTNRHQLKKKSVCLHDIMMKSTYLGCNNDR